MLSHDRYHGATRSRFYYAPGPQLDDFIDALRANLSRAQASTGRLRRESVGMAHLSACEVRRAAEARLIRLWLDWPKQPA